MLFEAGERGFGGTRCPFVYALVEPLAGDNLKRVGALEGLRSFGLFLNLPRIVAGGKHLSCLGTPLAGVSKVDIRVDA